MRVAININGQLKNMTGIQHSVDSLIAALYRAETDHELWAFATRLSSVEQLSVFAAQNEGTFAWRNLPQARFDLANEGRTLIPAAFRRKHVWLSGRLREHEVRLLGSRSNAPIEQVRKYDLLHNPDPSDLELLERRKHNVVTLYDLATRFCPWAYDAGMIALWERYFEYAKHRCARVLAISESTKRDVVEHLGIPEDRIDVTPLAAARASACRIEEGEERRKLLADLELAGTPFVLYAGTLEPRKNLERLVKAFVRVLREADLPDHKLVLAGGNWNRLDLELRLLACECGIPGRLVTTGYVSNQYLNALMSACDAFVYISRYEGFGMPPLEAMVCGAPVIVSNVSSMPEVAGEAGIQVSPDDTEAVAEAIHRLLTDPAENARRRALSRERAKHFTWERTAALTLRAYEAAVA